MIVAMILAGTCLPLLFLAFFLLGRCWQGWRFERGGVTDVARQHFEIFQSGEFNESAVEIAKRRFHVLFEKGGERAVEASIRPGPHFIYQVRALAEIGTEAAGRILERQLHRRLSENDLEQAWYWIDLAASLRALNRQESLPHLLRCSEDARESPLGHYFAAETVCMLGFSGYLRTPQSALGEAALRLVHRVVEGLRFGLPPQVVHEARLGELMETLWDHRPPVTSALHVRIFHEALRVLRRAPHLQAVVSDENADAESVQWQMTRIAALESNLRDYLKVAPSRLLARVSVADDTEREDLLLALEDLRVDAATALWPLMQRASCSDRDLIAAVLRWSRDVRVGGWLRDFIHARVPMAKRAQCRLEAEILPVSTVDPEIPYETVLRSLRGHPSSETEEFLISACQDWDPIIRMAALSSLGWWEPILHSEVHECLMKCKRDPSPEVRQMARASLARLGERASLHWFRQALLADDPHQVAEAAHVIADEGLTLLWPDLDRLIDCDNPDVALHAREAVERLMEEMELAR